MSALTPKPSVDITNIEALIINGDISKLNAEQRMQYYRYRCESLGVDPMSRPFDYITLQGKMVLYVNRAGTEQIRRINNVSIVVTDKQTVGDVFTVYVRASTPDGRTEDDCGAVSIKGLQGEALANAHMKAMTKAKRRATIAISSLGMLDESEVETIPGAHKVKEAPIVIPAELTPPPNGKPPKEVISIGPKPLKVPSPEELSADKLNFAQAHPFPPKAALGNTVLGTGKYKGFCLKDRSPAEWKAYSLEIARALLDQDFPEESRDEAKSLMKLIDSYVNAK